VIIFALLAVGLLGCVLLWAGLRGTRIDDHPVCRKCKFDLSGIQLGYATCPECGTQLTQDQILRGNRKRRPLVAATGAFLALPLILSGLLLFASPSTVVRALPNQSLVWFAQVSGDRTAVNELAIRMAAKSISQHQADALVQSALTRQGDPLMPWLEDWGNIVDEAILRGWVSDNDVRRFLMQAVIPDMAMTPRANAETLPVHRFRLYGNGDRPDCGLLGATPVEYLYDIDSATVAGSAWPLETIPMSESWPGRHESIRFRDRHESVPDRSGPQTWSRLQPLQVAPGTHEVQITLSVFARHPNDASQTWFRWTVPMRHTLQVRAPGESLTDLVMDPARNAAVRRCIEIEVHNRGTADHFVPQLIVGIQKPGMGVCMTAELWAGDTSWTSVGLAIMEYPAAPAIRIQTVKAPVPLQQSGPERAINAPKTVRVRLIPSPAQAAQGGMLDIAGLPIEFESVPVQSPGATP
jgi:hypothetical protein